MSTELASLNRVFHRIAITDDLSPALVKLLPRLIRRVTTEKDKECQGVLSKILSHILQRVRNDETQVPIVELLDMSDQRAICIPFLKFGIGKCKNLERLYQALPKAIDSHALVILIIEQIAKQNTDIDFSVRKEAINGTAHAVDLWMDLLLYTPTQSPSLPSPGLSPKSTKAIASVSRAVKLWVLSLHPDPLYILLAAASTDKAVADQALLLFQQYKKNYDSLPAPVVHQILTLCLGQVRVPHTLEILGKHTSQPDDLRSSLSPQASSTLIQLMTPLVQPTDTIAELAVKVSVPARLKLIIAVLPKVSNDFETITDIACKGLANSDTREDAYEILCLVPRLTQEDFLFRDLATLLFRSASQEQELLRHRALAALDALLEAYKRKYLQDTEIQTQKDVCSSLLPLLWNAAQKHQPKVSRVAAARWSRELLMGLDMVHAAHLLCFLSGDMDVTASSIAKEGLNVTEASLDTFEEEYAERPPFVDFVRRVFDSNSQSHSSLKHYEHFSYSGKCATLRYGLSCYLNSRKEDWEHGAFDAERLYLLSILFSLANDRQSLVLLDQASLCLSLLLEKSHALRKLFLAEIGAFSYRDLHRFTIESQSSKARRRLALCNGVLLGDLQLWKSENPNENDVGWFTRSGCDDIVSKCGDILNNLDSPSYSTGYLHGAAFLSAHAIRSIITNHVEACITDELPWSRVERILISLVGAISHSNDLVGNACADSLAIALSYDGFETPGTIKYLLGCYPVLLRSLEGSLKTFGHGDRTEQIRAAKVIHASGWCLAHTTPSGFREIEEHIALQKSRFSLFGALLDSVGGDAYRKDEEIHLIIGKALAQYAEAVNKEGIVEEWPPDFDVEKAQGMPPNEHTLYYLLRKLLSTSSPQKRTATSTILLVIVAQATRNGNSSVIYTRKPLFRSLLSHLEEIQSTFITLLADPKNKQLSRESCCLGLVACRGLLGANSSQATCEIDSEELNERLLRAFGETTRHQGSAYQETEQQAAVRRSAEGNRSSEGNVSSELGQMLESFGEEIDIGGVAGLSEANLGALREMAAASVNLGRPDILYSLLLLSVSHTLWSSKDWKNNFSSLSLLGKDSSASSGTSVTEIRLALRPHLGKLLPRMLRACNDPNKQTRDQMTYLFNGITGGGAEGRQLLTDYFLPIFDSLLLDTSNKLWRARVGAVTAIADLIVGRDWNSLGGGEAVLTDDDVHSGSTLNAGTRLLQLWHVVTRAADDTRGAVRESAEKLGRSLKSLCVRMCDPSASAESSGTKRNRDSQMIREKDASAASATCLRWLVEHGLSQKCTEAVGICMSTLIDVVRVVKASMLESIIGELLRSLLIAISGLEPAALNYLQLRVADQDTLERARIQLAQSGPIATAVQKCLELTPSLDVSIQRKIVSELDTALRLSVGFASRAATADAVSQLCSTCPNAFYFRAFSGTANPTVRLFRGLYHAMERERGEAAKDKLCHAFGNLAALCPGGSVRYLTRKICDRYTRSSGGSNDDPVLRRASAAAVRAIAVRASSQFGEGEVWPRKVLPIAFLGRQDPDERISKYWSEVWEEGGSVTQVHSRTHYGTTLEENILTDLVKEICIAIDDVSWARRRTGADALLGLSGILSPLEGSRGERRARCVALALGSCLRLLRQPRLWDGKHSIVKTTCQLIALWRSDTSTHSPVDSDTEESADMFNGDQWFTTVVQESDELENEPDSVVESGLSTTEDDNDDNDVAVDEDMEKEDIADDEIAAKPIILDSFSRFLMEEALKTPKVANDESLPYRVECLKGIYRLRPLSVDSEKLTKLVQTEGEPALLVATGMKCLSLNPTLTTIDLSSKLRDHVAWTVREASALSVASWIEKAPEEWLRSMTSIRFALDLSQRSMEDRKFTQCRLAGLKVLEALISRCAQESLVHEATLPCKDDVVKILRRGLTDDQASITSKSSEIMQSIKNWP